MSNLRASARAAAARTVIVNLAQQTCAKCFVEIDEAVAAIDREAGRDRVVAFNAHRGGAPDGATIYNLENIPRQVPDHETLWAGRTVWDFSSGNAAKYAATYVPVGYHPSMERFKRAKEPDIDVVFSGVINERRAVVLNALQAKGLSVVVVPTRLYGRGRDALLARARVALNMLFYQDGVCPALRVAHLVANHVPVISERAREEWSFIQSTPYDKLVDGVVSFLATDGAARVAADRAYEEFKSKPMSLPS